MANKPKEQNVTTVHIVFEMPDEPFFHTIVSSMSKFLKIVLESAAANRCDETYLKDLNEAEPFIELLLTLFDGCGYRTDTKAAIAFSLCAGLADYVEESSGQELIKRTKISHMKEALEHGKDKDGETC